MRITLSEDQRFLDADFERPQRTLSWAIVGGGFGVHRRVVWHFVRREELSWEVEPAALLRERLAAGGYEAAVGLLTARHLGPYADASATFGAADARPASARAIVTVGLGNALRAGDPPAAPSVRPVGTINVLCQVSVALTDEALIEALALACEARTAALLEARYPSVVSELPATGTGTDCIVLACALAGDAHGESSLARGTARFDASQGSAEPYAGKHTAVGAAIGRSVYEASKRATHDWLVEQGKPPHASALP